MKEIGFKNFRKYKDFKTMTLKPITIFTGGNNAGKSTVVKAILTLNEFLSGAQNPYIKDDREFPIQQNDVYQEEQKQESPKKKLDRRMKTLLDNRFYFNKNYFTHIGTFKRALYNKATEEVISFDTIVNNYHDLSISVERDGDDDAISGRVSHIVLRDRVLNVEYEFDFNANSSKVTLHKMPGVMYEDYLEGRKALLEMRKEKIASSTASSRRSFLSRLQQEIEDMESYFNEIKHDITFSLKIVEDYPNDDYMQSDDLISGLVEKILYDLDSTMDSDAEITGEEDENDRHRFRWRRKLREGEVPPVVISDLLGTDYLKFIAKHVNVLRRTYPSRVADEVEYIYAHAVTQNVIYHAKDKSDYLVRVVDDYANASITTATKRWMTRWMSSFGIGKDCVVEPFGGESNIVKIINKDGSIVNLADKGMGSIQLMTLLFRLATIINEGNPNYMPLVLVEEPEQNLHPNLQSKLAELFWELNQVYRIPFVIETHSEYLIRKTQVIVAEMNSANDDEPKKQNPFVVYYFSDEKKQPYYEMRYKENGMFQDEFGSGFFDEATNMFMQIALKNSTLEDND